MAQTEITGNHRGEERVIGRGKQKPLPHCLLLFLWPLIIDLTLAHQWRGQLQECTLYIELFGLQEILSLCPQGPNTFKGYVQSQHYASQVIHSLPPPHTHRHKTTANAGRICSEVRKCFWLVTRLLFFLALSIFTPDSIAKAQTSLPRIKQADRTFCGHCRMWMPSTIPPLCFHPWVFLQAHKDCFPT